MSDIDSEDDNINNINLDDLVENEPMYHVLAEFLETPDNKNIATVLDDICKELKLIRLNLAALTTSAPTSSKEPTS